MDETQTRLITMGFHHECQHQELLVYDLQHLLAGEYRPVKKKETPVASQVNQESILVKEDYTIGLWRK